jgi:hypothetical protein
MAKTITPYSSTSRLFVTVLANVFSSVGGGRNNVGGLLFQDDNPSAIGAVWVTHNQNAVWGMQLPMQRFAANPGAGVPTTRKFRAGNQDVTAAGNSITLNSASLGGSMMSQIRIQEIA